MDPIVDLSHPTGCMTPSDESPRDVRSTTDSLLGPKTTIRLAAWNVRTMFETSRTAQVISEMRRYRLDILGISECRWTGSGRRVNSDGSVTLHSGHDSQHIRGVALIVSKEKVNTLQEWEPLSDRLIRARFNSKHCKLTILQCYAPTNEADEEDKDDWYEELQQAVFKVPQHDMLLIMGDMNAKVGADNTDCDRAMGKHGCGVMNDNGERLIGFCLENNCVIGGTIFPHRNIHKLTWKSPDGSTVNQIDHILINGKWRRSLQDVRVCRGADVNSDHYLVTATIKLKLRKVAKQNQSRKHLDVAKLKCPNIIKEFALRLKNRFAALADDDEDPSVNTKWETIKKTYVETATNVLGYRRKKNKEWITAGTWQKIEERKQLKAKILSTKSLRLREQAQEAYKIKDKEVKKSARNDKRAFAEELAGEAERAAARGEISTVYKITKQLCGKNTSQSAPVKDKDGNNLTTERDQAARWVQHFREVLNRPEPDDLADPPPAEDVLNINTSPPTEAEVRCAIKAMKSGKAPGIDSIHAEMLKADLGTSTKVLTDLFRDIWETDTLPGDWTKGLIVKIPKKGNLRDCHNWRGITLLSIPSKVFCRILLARIDAAIDTVLRQEQAGFRGGRGCIDQIFALRNIIEQCIEWNTPLYINFIDFRKAFDSVHRDTLWKILKTYGVPPKMVTLMGLFYDQFECSVIIDNNLSEWFSVESGVRQGCIISPILFLLAIDWIMCRTTADRPRGIQWSLFSQLEDLDFADDIAALSTTRCHLQEKTDRLSKFAKQAGLNINTFKTKVMCINATPDAPITAEGEQLDFVEEFTYLGSLVAKDNAAQKDIKARLGKARGAFARLQPVWKSKQFSLGTKLRLYNSVVKPVLLYGAECWRVIKSDMNKINAFHNGCLRRICRIFWPNKISNKELYKKTKSQSVILEIKRRRIRWLGHVLRMGLDRIPKTALRWTPPGKRRRGRPKTTWRRTVMAELSEMGLSWGEAQHAAKDRSRWKQIIDALCPARDEED